MKSFNLSSALTPTGDQPKAIETLVNAITAGETDLVMKGVTGSGKTFTMANVIERLQRPTLVISHNKTLAAQLYSEFQEFFPDNAVEYFVSYYDYYQPEAYLPSSDTYIEKDASINDEIDRMRLAATSSLFERRDVIIVASVSCIYGLGSPEDYAGMNVNIEVGKAYERDRLLRDLVKIQYARNDITPERSTFRVRGDVVEIVPAYRQHIIRVELFGDEVESISRVDPLTGDVSEKMNNVSIWPAKHFVAPQDKVNRALEAIEAEMHKRVAFFKAQNKVVEAARIEQRTRLDMEMIQEIGYCTGIENYSRHMSGRAPGKRPYTLLDYFPKDFLTMIDESHVTVPQVRGMLAGDRSRKTSLIDFGFRLPSAMDNRPMSFEEFRDATPVTIFVSATPALYEREVSKVMAEQVIRPTGLLDPRVAVFPIDGQIDRLMDEARKDIEKGGRALVTTLTKKMAEDLTQFLLEREFKVRYLHSEINTIERVEIITGLRRGEFDLLVGVNLLREGLDLPEVSLVIILDADKEGFLRTDTSLIQTIGRAARNAEGRVIMFADHISDAMKRAIEETKHRRGRQEAYNQANGITPQSIKKSIRDGLMRPRQEEADDFVAEFQSIAAINPRALSKKERQQLAKKLRQDMLKAARNLQFEKAAILRDKISEISRAGHEEEKEQTTP